MNASARRQLRREQLEIVEGSDDLAAGEELLEVVAILQRSVAEDALPERGGGGVVGRSRVESGLDHERLFSSPCATVFAPGELPRNPSPQTSVTLGWPTGLEPATARITIWSSTIELWPPTQLGF